MGSLALQQRHALPGLVLLAALMAAAGATALAALICSLVVIAYIRPVRRAETARDDGAAHNGKRGRVSAARAYVHPGCRVNTHNVFAVYHVTSHTHVRRHT